MYTNDLGDKKWTELNKELLVHASQQNWGLYRNTRFEMAEQLRKEGNLLNAAATFLEICFLDLNGPENCGCDRSRTQFDVSMALIAPGIIKRLKAIAKKANLDLIQIQQLFLSHNMRLHEALRLPRKPSECWAELRAHLSPE
jgi:hypothetical protein